MRIVCMYILFFSFSIVAKAQNDSTGKLILLAEFSVKDVRFNSIDYTKEAIDGKNNLYFYKYIGVDNVYMKNVWEKEDSQSFGPIHSLSYKYFEETDEFYEFEEYKFIWSYENTFDEKVGTCEAILRLEYKPRGIYFDLKIYPEDLEELHYRGEFKGSMEFIKYLVDK
jgi:hypothetical protein